MRTSVIIAFSVPPDFQAEIQEQAKAQHRTISEYIREAVRRYMALSEFYETRKKITKRLKKKGLKPTDVEAVLRDLRKSA